MFYFPLAVFVALNTAFLLYLFATVYPEMQLINYEIVSIYFIDSVILFLILLVFFTVNKNKLVKIKHYFITTFSTVFEKNKVVLMVVATLAFLVEFIGWQSFIVDGLKRESILEIYKPSYFILFTYKPLLFCLVFFFFSKIRNIYALPIFILLIFMILLLQSRTDLMFVIYIALITIWMKNEKVVTLKRILLFSLVIFSAVLLSIYQGRVKFGFESVAFLLDTFFRYKIVAVELAEYVVTLNVVPDNVTFPFFGFISEKVNQFFSGVNEPLVSGGATFMADFRPIKISGQGNSLYPWWAWFYYFYGVLGLFLKNLFLAMLLFLFLNYKFIITFMYILIVAVFIQSWRHPFLSTSDFYTFIGCIVFDLYFVFYSKIFHTTKTLTGKFPVLKR